jgi:hypothetical protein
MMRIVIIGLCIASAPVRGEEMGIAEGGTEIGLSEATKGGIGCLVAAGATMAASLWAGGTEVIMIAGGGSLAASSVTTIYMGLAVTAVAWSCAVGFAATPAVLWFAEQVGTLFEDPPGSPAATAIYPEPERILARYEHAGRDWALWPSNP